MTEREQGLQTPDALYRGWRDKHPDLLYSEKRWYRPGGPGEYSADQVPYGEIMESISDHVGRVLGGYDPLRVRALYETALRECQA